MSMLSAQIKELRETARQFEGYQHGEMSRMLREAADTIESLRDRCCTQPHRAIPLGQECPFCYEFGVPSCYPVNRERNERRSHEIKAKLNELRGDVE